MTCGPNCRSGRRALRSWQSSLRQIEDDRLGEEVVLLGQCDERLASLRLDVGGVDDGQPSPGEPLPDDLVQKVEGVAGGGLIVLVVGDKRAAEVGGDDLGRQEVLSGERRLAAAGRADEEDERELRDADFHAATSF